MKPRKCLSQAHVVVSLEAQHVSKPVAPASITEPPAMLPLLHVRDVDRWPGPAKMSSNKMFGCLQTYKFQLLILVKMKTHFIYEKVIQYYSTKTKCFKPQGNNLAAQPSLSKLLRRAHSLLAQDQLLDPTMASLVSEGTTAAEKTPLASNPLFPDQEGSSRGVLFKQLFCLTIYSILFFFSKFSNIFFFKFFENFEKLF